jgi:hypothetical protein
VPFPGAGDPRHHVAVAYHEVLALHAQDGGRLWLSVGETTFPGEGWSDLVEPLLEDWIPQLLPLISGYGGAAVLTFMDGPYEARLESGGGFAWSVRLFANRRLVLSDTVDGSAFGQSVREAIMTAGGDRARGWLPHVEAAIEAAR